MTQPWVLTDWPAVGQETRGGPSRQQCAAESWIKAATYFIEKSFKCTPPTRACPLCPTLQECLIWSREDGGGESIWFKPTCWHVVAERSARNSCSNSFERGKRCPSGWELWGKQAQAWRDGISKYFGGGNYVHMAMCLGCLCFDLARWATGLSCPHYFIRWNLLYFPLPRLHSSFSPIFKPLLFTPNPFPSFFLKSLGHCHTFAALSVFKPSF